MPFLVSERIFSFHFPDLTLKQQGIGIDTASYFKMPFGCLSGCAPAPKGRGAHDGKKQGQ